MLYTLKSPAGIIRRRTYNRDPGPWIITPDRGRPYMIIKGPGKAGYISRDYISKKPGPAWMDKGSIFKSVYFDF